MVQPGQAATEVLQPDSAPEAGQAEAVIEAQPPVIDEAKIRAQERADIEVKRIKPLEQAVSRADVRARQAEAQAAEDREYAERIEALIKTELGDTVDKDMQLARFQSREAAHQAPTPTPTVSQSDLDARFAAIEATGKELGIDVRADMTSPTPKLDWTGFRHVNAQNPNLDLVDLALRVTQASVERAAHEKRLADIKAEAEAERAADKEELRKLQRVSTGAQRGAGATDDFRKLSPLAKIVVGLREQEQTRG